MPWPSGVDAAELEYWGAEGAGAWALIGGPPAAQGAVGVGAGVAEQVGEEAVRAEGVLDGRRRGEAAVAVEDVVAAGRVVPAHRGDVGGAEVGDGVAPKQ
jgi:hypothetical protein